MRQRIEAEQRRKSEEYQRRAALYQAERAEQERREREKERERERERERQRRLLQQQQQQQQAHKRQWSK